MPEHAAVCGTEAEPAPLDAVAEAVAISILTLKRVPKRPRFLCFHLSTDMGGSARHWQREFKLGHIWGFLGPDGWETYWPFLVRYVAERQNVASFN